MGELVRRMESDPSSRVDVPRQRRRAPWLDLAFAAAVLGALSLLMKDAGAQPRLCAGDCGGDGRVAISELILGVSISLGTRSIDRCPAFDVNGDGSVFVAELISGVSNSLSRCPSENTPTASPTASTSPSSVPPTVSPIPDSPGAPMGRSGRSSSRLRTQKGIDSPRGVLAWLVASAALFVLGAGGLVVHRREPRAGSTDASESDPGRF
jgi:hypothetical protein